MIHRAMGSSLPRITRGFALALATAMLGANVAMAQDAEDVEPDEPPKQPVVRNQVILQDRTIERQIYSVNSGSAAYTRTKAESQLRLRIDDLDRLCSLTDAQKKKLALAGRGELKLFFDEVDATIRQLKSTQNEPRKKGAAAVAVAKVARDVNPLRSLNPLRARVARGFFGPDSFYYRTVKNTLNAEQMSKFEVVSQGRHAYRFQAKLELTLGLLDATVGFREDQRERLLKILQDEVPVPGAINEACFYYVVYCMARIEEAKLKPLFDEDQWRIFQSLFQQIQGYETHLKANGYEPPPRSVGR